jgi:2,4-dienoyl-CoA reductase-like NADH-dependent reductase (Old Yellow Enzyme family)
LGEKSNDVRPNFELLSAPIHVAGKTIKNRIVVPPMADFGATQEDGLVNERHIRHYKSFAEGGAGLVIIEACAVSRMNEPRNTIGLYHDDCIPGMARLAHAAKTNGATSLVQLINTGLSVMPGNRLSEISKEQLMQYMTDFLAAAVRCQKAGFDGAELHAAHGFFLNQLIEENDRADEYGGGFSGRFLFIRELIGEIKTECGPDFLVSVRFGCSGQEELTQEALAIEEAGGDLLDVSSGCASSIPVPDAFPHDRRLYMASLVKNVAHVPVIGVGGIQTSEQAERILENAYADMAAVGTGHLCDSRWAEKTFSGKPLVMCKSCRQCRWYIDGAKCPARKEWQ